MTEQAGENGNKIGGKTWAVFTTGEKVLLVLGSLVAVFAGLGVTRMLGVPSEPGFNGSLLAGQSPIVSILAAYIAIIVCMVIGSLVAAFIEEEAGLLCGGVGLAALAVRCGPVRPVLQFASGTGVLALMALEVILLGAVLLATWWGLSHVFQIVRSRNIRAIAAGAPNEIVNPSLQFKLLTLGTQVLVSALIEQILIQSDAKPQAMAGVGIAAFGGSVAAYMATPLAEGVWYWAGPLLLAFIGYLLAYFVADPLGTGTLQGWTAALARPVPLDYAGVGTVGALVGYWSSRRWAQPEEEQIEQEIEPSIPSSA